MNIDDVVQELMKENTPEFTKWTLNNTNENLANEDKEYISVHGVRILTMHLKTDDSIIDFIVWIRLTKLQSETEELYEFWVQSVLVPTEYQKKILDNMTKEEILSMINNINITYTAGTLCNIEDKYFAYIQKSLLPKDNAIAYIKAVLDYVVTRGVPISVASINKYLMETDKSMTNASIIDLIKVSKDYQASLNSDDSNENYLIKTEDTEDIDKFFIWFKTMMKSVVSMNSALIIDIHDLQISNVMLKKILDIFKQIMFDHPSTVFMFYDSTRGVDNLLNIHKDQIFKEFFKVFTKHKDLDKLNEKEYKDLCTKYHETVSAYVNTMFNRQEKIEEK